MTIVREQYIAKIINPLHVFHWWTTIFIDYLGLVQTLNFSCAGPNANDTNRNIKRLVIGHWVWHMKSWTFEMDLTLLNVETLKLSSRSTVLPLCTKGV